MRSRSTQKQKDPRGDRAQWILAAVLALAGLVLILVRIWGMRFSGFLLLGLAALYVGMPDFPATDPITAAAVGVAAGLAATGLDQAVKQLKK